MKSILTIIIQKHIYFDIFLLDFISIFHIHLEIKGVNMTKTSDVLSIRINRGIKEEFEKYALLSHTTTKEILIYWIY